MSIKRYFAQPLRKSRHPWSQTKVDLLCLSKARETAPYSSKFWGYHCMPSPGTAMMFGLGLCGGKAQKARMMFNRSRPTPPTGRAAEGSSTRVLEDGFLNI